MPMTTRTALLLPLALLGLSTPAFAADIDEVAASMLDGHDEALELDLGIQERSRSTSSRSRGGKTVTRSTGTNGRGQTKQKVTRSNGSKSQSTTRGRSVSGSTNHRRDHGDWVSSRDTSVKQRSSTTRSNGTKSATRSSGSVTTSSDRRGVAGGQRFSDHSGSRSTRSQGTMTAPKGSRSTASTRTTVDRSRATTGRRVVEHRKSTTTVRPGSTTHVRPSASPARPRTVHVRPGTASVRPSTVHVRPRTSTRVVTYTHVRPYHGVFVYGPRPTTHVHYATSSGPAQVPQRHLPERQLDRANSLALGLKMGSLTSGYVNGGAYSDLGLGLAGRYRPAESVGLQMDLVHHAQSYTLDTERSQTLAAGSVQLFAFPWTRVSPYAVGGVTYDARNLNDHIGSDGTSATVIANDSLWGLHGGLGLELALGDSVALDLEGRYIGYLDKSPTDPSAPGALQLTGGLMFHF
jgi:opacity protein-like surface antigen